MPVFAFILIGGIWAAFLLPSFIDGRRKTPSKTTRSFARSTALLASVSSSTSQEIAARRRAQLRRQRVLLALFVGAIGALAIAVWLGSVPWLGVAIAFDVAIAIYVALMLHMQNRQRMAATRVVPFAPAQAPQQPAVVQADEQRHTVRVVGG